MSKAPSPAADNGGRQQGGKFGAGNKFGTGNPHAARVQRLRSALLAAIKPADVKEIVRKLIEQARNGDTAIAKLIFDRTLGRAEALDVLEKIEALEEGRT